MMINFRRTLASLTFAIAVGGTTNLYAIMANPKPVLVKQPDGTALTVKIYGDENHHYVTTLDGYQIATDNLGVYRYVTLSNGRFVLSDVKAHNIEERSIKENNHLLTLSKASQFNAEWMSSHKVQRKVVDRTLDASVLNPSASGSWNMKRYLPNRVGAEPNESQYLCILVNFADCRMRFKNDDFNRFLNEPNYAGYGSVKDYFRENSGGKFVPNFVTVGPYNLSKPTVEYASNDSPDGSDIDPRGMVREAIKLAKEKNPNLDFRQFDNDGDGFMDNCYIIYAGYSEASTGEANDMWPHSWTLGDEDVLIDGITVHTYSCSQELVGSPGNPTSPSMDGIGTFTHEFGHILGLKDMYDTDDYYNGKGIDPGAYSLYASGSYNNDSKTPAALWAFERHQMGWMEIGKDILELKKGEDVTQHNSAETFTARYIDCQPGRTSGTGHEWFILENRQFSGWDEFIPGHGLLIYHYDYTQDMVDKWWSSNGPNNNARHRCLYIKPADGIDDDNSRPGDTYPGSSANTSFTDFSVPGALNWQGLGANVPITNIIEHNGLVSYQAAGGSTKWNVINTNQMGRILDTQAEAFATIVQHAQDIAEAGFCWEEDMKEPTLASSHISVPVADDIKGIITGLKSGSIYTVKAYMILADGSIFYGSPMNFMTEYATAYAPFTSDFNSWTNGKINGWEIVDNNSDGTTWVYDKQTKSICYQFDYWNNADDWLICKRRFHIPENGMLYFKRGVNEEQFIEGLEIYVSTQTSALKDFYLHKQFTFADNFGRQVYEEVDLSMYKGQDIYIALRCNSEKLQGLLRLWDIRLEQKLATPSITYFGHGENEDQLKIQWSEVPDAAKYYLYLGRITDVRFKNYTFTTPDFYHDYSQNVDLATGHLFFKGSGFVELKHMQEGYEDLKFMIYPTGPIGVSYLEVEGTIDENTWIPVCPRTAIGEYDPEGIECNFQSYVEGRGYKSIRLRLIDNGRLAHVRYLTVGYNEGYVWDQLAAGSVTGTEALVNAKTIGEFKTGSYVCWVASGNDSSLFFDESVYAYYEPRLSSNDGETGIEDAIEGTDVKIQQTEGTITIRGLEVGCEVLLSNIEGMLLSSSISSDGTVVLVTNGYQGFALLKVGNVTRKIIIR